MRRELPQARPVCYFEYGVTVGFTFNVAPTKQRVPKKERPKDYVKVAMYTKGVEQSFKM